MEMVLTILGIVMICIAVAGAVFEKVWKWKKKLEKNSLEILILKLITFIILFLLSVPVLVIQVSLGEYYAIAIFLLILFTYIIASIAYDIGKYKGKTRE